LRHKLNLVVVVISVGDENQVGGQVVTAARAGVNVNDAPVVQREAAAPVALIVEI
jgi:hypothetical protein